MELDKALMASIKGAPKKGRKAPKAKKKPVKGPKQAKAKTPSRKRVV